MGTVRATCQDGDLVHVQTRGHQLLLDQPAAAGGMDAGPTPTELFAAALASCIVFYAERFLRRNGVRPEGLHVECGYQLSTDKPHRVESFDVKVEPPAGTPARLSPALQRVAQGCTVHETLRHPPDVTIEVVETPVSGAA